MRRHRRGLTLQPTGQRGRGKGNSCKEAAFPQARGKMSTGRALAPASTSAAPPAAGCSERSCPRARHTAQEPLAAAYGGEKDARAAWAAGVLAVGAGPMGG